MKNQILMLGTGKKNGKVLWKYSVGRKGQYHEGRAETMKENAGVTRRPKNMGSENILSDFTKRQ